MFKIIRFFTDIYKFMRFDIWRITDLLPEDLLKTG